MSNAEQLYTDKQGNQVKLEELCKGKNADQVLAVKFFQGIPIEQGCINSTYLSYNGYMELVNKRLGSVDYKKRALENLGIDADQVKEIDPVNFTGFRYDYAKLQPYNTFRDGHFCSSMYDLTWIFFGDEQVYIYYHSFDTTDETKSDTTLEYFYTDINAFAASSDSVEKKIWVTEGEGCSAKRELQNKTVTSEVFSIQVPGDKFTCALTEAGKYANAISAMKQKLREKKKK